MTKKDIKNTFNAISKKAGRKFKYKRCIKNSKENVLFEAYHYENTVYSNFYGIKLLDYNKRKNMVTWYCRQKDIKNINKYNLTTKK
tara:strand:+ start:20 stop:277 length:258 start_codon:yes stop_codon:yes gene_type:complete